METAGLCRDGVVVMGEYGLTNSLMKRGFNIDTLMAKYKKVSAGVLAQAGVGCG